MYHLRRIKTMVLLLLVCVVAKAQPEAGKIYRFVNKANPEQSLAVVSETKSSVSPTADHYLQYWLLETHPGNASTWTLRNLGNGKYLQRAGRSVFWGFVDAASDATPLYYLTQDGYCTFSSANNVNDGACMHYASSQGGIVGWDFSADATQWTMTEISSVKADDLTANWEALDEFNKAYDDDMANDYASALDALFADAACTTLESTYASMSVSAIQEDANYKALPAALQELVLKVRNGVWTEANFVDGKAEWESDQAKKFRVQLYEPYSIAGDITGWLGINAHNNMDNPTGIFADCRDVVYVMVEGTIKEGASLYLYGLRGHGQIGSYNDDNAVQLHEGLNVVPYISDGNALWINYVVDTYNGNGSTDEERFQYKLSSYGPLKINIAGGHINGYYNAVGDDLWGAPDDDTDWAYYKDRASLESFTLLSHRVTMQFYMYTTNGSPGLYNLLDNIAVPEKPYCFSGTKGTSATFSQYEGMGLDASTGKINIMLEAWNRIAYSQFATLGVLDAATIDKMNEKYPRWYNNWTERGKIYDYTTGNDGQSYEEYCGGVDYSEYFNHHCLAISNTTGYMSGGWKSSNYNINTAESIIDKIANEAGPVWGPAHEIGHQHQALFTLNGLTEVTNNLHSNVAVWYMGMGTSRVNGTEGSLAKVLEAFNTEGSDYYTNNIWALTQMYYRLWLYYHLAGNNTQFYPRLMENLRREPLEKGYNVGPGGLLRFYKHCCVAAGEDLTEFFRAHGLLSVMTDRFVGDYSNSVYNQSQEQIDAAIAEVKALGLPVNIAPLFISDATPDVTYGHDGTTQRSYWDGNSTSSGNNAEVGSYIDFVNGEAVGTAPTLTIESTTVTIDGLDGVGIAIFNEKGEIVGFSTKSTFELSEECAALLASGEATVQAVNADNSTVPIEVTDPTQIKYGLLGDLLDEANGMLALSDDTNTKLGWYRPSALKALNTAYTKAKEVYDAQDANSYTAAYDMLKIAYDEVRNNADAVISLKTGSGYAYRLTNKAYATLSMAVETSDGENKDEMFALTTAETYAQFWYFEASDTEGRYYLKNKSTEKYPGNVTSGAVLKADKTKDGAYAYELRDMGQGVWALVGNTGLHCSASQSYNIVGWGTDAEATLWYITAVEVDDIAEARDELENLVEKTEAMMAEVGEVAVGEANALTLTESNYYCNAECKETTYGDQFTSYSVLCDGSSSTFLHTDYSSQAPSEDHYIRIDMGADNGLQYFNLNYTTRGGDGNVCAPTKMSIEVSNDDTNWVTLRDITSGLPITNNASYTIEELGYGTSYRYVRMRVYGTSGSQKANGHYYFILSELGLSMISYAETLNSTYTSMTEGVLLDAFKANLAAQGVLVTATTSAEYKAAYTTLETRYNALLAAKKVVDDAVLNAKKAELQTLIDNTTSLISSCGTVTYTPATYSGTPKLQTSDSNADFYVWTNAQEADEGPIADLVDGNNNTFFHSDYSGANSTDGLDHHITINLGEGNEVSSFTFGYVTRHNADTNYPETIEVYGSENGTGYELLTTVSGLPSGKTQTYNSGEAVVASKFYSNLRFMVTATNNNNKQGGHPIFHMAEFTLTAIGTPESYTVELGNDAGGATEALMLAAYKENASAQATHTLATTLSQVEEAIAKLQGDYDALKSAKESTVEKTYYVQVVGGNANGGVEYGGKSYLSSASFEAPINLTVANLTAIPLDGYAEPVVTLNGTTITVTYNKEYTVQVTGGGGNGGVTYNGNDYAHNATITVLQDIDEAQLEAKDVDGYYPGVITVNHETKVITVTYTMTPLVDTEKYYTLECKSSEDHSTERFIGDNRSVIDGRSAEGTRFLFERANDENGYYMKSMISGKYLNHDENNNLYASADRVTVWTIAKTLFESLNYPFTLTVGNNLYLNNYLATDCTDGSCVDLRSNLHNEGVGSGNACSLWTLVEYDEPYDKTELNTLLGEVKGLVASCYTDEVFNYTGSIYVTEALMTATDEKVSAAQTAYDDKTTAKVVYDAALEALQTAKTNLQYAIECALFPVLLTVDPASPELYIIKTKRDGDNMVLQYDEPTELFSVAASVDKEPTQAFYFMKGDGSQVYIYPYMAGGKVLAANEVGNASGTAFAMEKGSATYEQWVFVARADGYYNLQPAGTSTYLSNIYGTSHKMGFYGSNPDTDKGSLFKFESTTVEGSYYYLKLKDYYENQAKVAGSNIQGGEAVGYYPTDKANAYNSAYSNATNVLASATSTDEEYTNAYDALKAANEALVPNMPEEGKFYRFVSADTKNGRADGVVYANPADNKMYWSKEKETSDATAIWTIAPADNGTYHITNLHTGTSIGEFIGSNPSPLREEGGAVSIKPLSGDGQVGFISNGTMMHAQGDYSAIVHWETGAGDASAWRIVEVEDMSLVNFALKIGQYRHAGLYLNYAVEIPEGIQVYVVHTSDEKEEVVIADELEGTILPARTAVIVKGDADTYNFKYTSEDYDGNDDLSVNLLGGSAYLKFQQVEETGKLCCVFGQKGGEVGLYKNWVGYIDANGTAAEDANGDGKVNQDNGTHFKISANKIYYEYKPSDVAGASAFRFRFNSKEEDATPIGGLLITGDTVIYNLYGQRLIEIVEPGIYIINGKKMYVSEKMIGDNK